MSSLSEIKRSFNAQMIDVAQQDPGFRQSLLANPKAAIQRQFGVSLPPGIELKVVEETATTNYLVLPAATEDELSEADLDAVAGGSVASAGAGAAAGMSKGAGTGTAAYQAWFTCLKSCADSKGEVQKQLARF